MEWALDTDPETLIATAHGEVHATGARCASWPENLDCPVLVVHGDRDRIAPPRDGRALARLGGGRLEAVPAPATSRTPASRCRSTWRCATSPRTPSGGRARRATPPSTAPTAVPAPSTSPHRSGSATPSATSRSPASCVACTRTSRSTGSPRTRSRGCSRRRASASIPPAPTWPMSRATSSRSPPSTTCTASTRCAAWTRSSPPTSCSSTTSCATSATTCGSGTRRGSSTTTCTRTRARSVSRSRG